MITAKSQFGGRNLFKNLVLDEEIMDKVFSFEGVDLLTQYV